MSHCEERMLQGELTNVCFYVFDRIFVYFSPVKSLHVNFFILVGL
jgi:hypothetical protein